MIPSRSRSRWKRLAGLSLLVLVQVLALVPLSPARADPPNVVLVMTDDQGYGDIASHGNPHLRTPHLDRLAADGARFSRFYVSPVCAPTRASLLTGRYALRTGTHGVTRGRENMRSEETTLAELLRGAGYATGCFGKWHNGAHYPMDPNGQGFDEFLGFTAGHWNNYFDTTLLRNGVEVPTKGYIADVLTDAAIAFVRTNAGRRFFAYLPLNTPHSPWQVPETYWQRFRPAPSDATDGKSENEAAAPELDAKAACAYAMCENIDDNVGRLLAALDELSLAERTIVVFLTDNGVNSDRFNAGMRGRKGSVHEGGVRVPLFVRWPDRVPAGRIVEPIAMHIDLLPTLARLCEVSLPGDLSLDGRDLSALLLGERDALDDRSLFTFRSGGGAPSATVGAVRTERWRAVRERAGGWQLYDMRADPGQTRDLAAAHAETLAELSGAFEAKFAEVTRIPLAPLAIPVGWAARPSVVLPAHECELRPRFGEGIRYVGSNGWANDWVTEWVSTDAWPEWGLEVAVAGEYEVSLSYTATREQIGCRLRVEAESAKGIVTLETQVTELHDPASLPSPDRVPRGEVYEKRWRSHLAGRMRLERGVVTLRVRALELPGGRAIDLKDVRLVRREDIDPPARLAGERS